MIDDAPRLGPLCRVDTPMLAFKFCAWDEPEFTGLSRIGDGDVMRLLPRSIWHQLKSGIPDFNDKPGHDD